MNDYEAQQLKQRMKYGRATWINEEPTDEGLERTTVGVRYRGEYADSVRKMQNDLI